MVNQHLIELKVYKRRRRHSVWKKKRNMFLNSLSKGERLLETTNIFNSLTPTQRTLIVPSVFSTTHNIEQVIEFINACKLLIRERRRLVFFNFRKVEKVNAGALALLLSVIHDLSELKIPIQGNMPKNPKPKQEFIDSGFLDFFTETKGRKKASKNKILVQGGEHTKQKETAIELQKAMYTVFGIPRFNQSIQTALIEMMANSVNHAFPIIDGNGGYFFEEFIENKRWYLSLSHDQQNKKVYFSFVDNGIGIINTIKRGIFRKAVDKLTSSEILVNAFNGDYRSSTDQKERGHGLPTIKEVFQKGAIKDLKVVTNDYQYSFVTNVGSRLRNNFEGTVYFWTLDETCCYGNLENQ